MLCWNNSVPGHAGKYTFVSVKAEISIAGGFRQREGLVFRSERRAGIDVAHYLSERIESAIHKLFNN